MPDRLREPTAPAPVFFLAPFGHTAIACTDTPHRARPFKEGQYRYARDEYELSRVPPPRIPEIPKSHKTLCLRGSGGLWAPGTVHIHMFGGAHIDYIFVGQGSFRSHRVGSYLENVQLSWHPCRRRDNTEGDTDQLHIVLVCWGLTPSLPDCFFCCREKPSDSFEFVAGLLKWCLFRTSGPDVDCYRRPILVFSR